MRMALIKKMVRTAENDDPSLNRRWLVSKAIQFEEENPELKHGFYALENK